MAINESDLTGIEGTDENGEENGAETSDDGFLEIEAETKGRPAISFRYNAGLNLKNAVELYGESVVYDLYTANLKVRAQAQARRYLREEKPADFILLEMAKWKPGVSRARGARVTKPADVTKHLTEHMDQYSPAELLRIAEMIRQKFPGGMGETVSTEPVAAAVEESGGSEETPSNSPGRRGRRS